MLALLTAFIEQVMRPGIAFEYRKHGFPRALRLVITMGMPALIYRRYFRAHWVRGLERSVLKFAGMKPFRETLLGRWTRRAMASDRAGSTGRGTTAAGSFE
jgi:putative NADPH-quinone reductase